MFKFAFILIIIILVANIYYLVKNFREEKKAVEERMKENSNGSRVNSYSTKNTVAKNDTSNKSKSSKKKNYTYKK